MTDLETGKVLLKSPKKYKNDNDVFLVPDNYNDGIKPFMQIKMEQLQDEIGLLIKPRKEFDSFHFYHDSCIQV